MDIPIITYDRGEGITLEKDLGVVSGLSIKDFDIDFVSSATIVMISLTTSISCNFEVSIYERQAREVKDKVWEEDSEGMQIISKIMQLRYNDLDCKNKLYLRVANNNASDLNFRVKIKYE